MKLLRIFKRALTPGFTFQPHTPVTVKFRGKTAQEGLASDWQAVGDDLRFGIGRYAGEKPGIGTDKTLRSP